ncbi:two-component sensor histidine kinase [Desulfuribacillus stibiiarsenatis]|uniref:histidine kinase n=1 Tax=Desulfuribacillus stibiiarsenatis TaxID=1390249 RepID=A0A1E5L8I7_9FIRM|nr:HAMP domain-containing sensor histidine kinase [Desulfuribacillus stibiiarsenatis]OEH86436.1 two-component sensor histidine kinase [Desulfuribacillus stibiiarsenatis]
MSKRSLKNLPLFMQIWLVFAAITLGITVLLAVLFPWTLRDFFTKEIYATIESAQQGLLNNNQPREFDENNFGDRRQLHPPSDRGMQMQNMRTVNHVILFDQERFIGPSRLPRDFVNTLREQATAQQQDSQRYSAFVEEKKVFYVIQKAQVLEHPITIVSFLWDTYRDDLVATLFNRLLLIMAVVFLLSWIPAFLLARYLSKPLTTLGNHVTRLANREWHTPIQLDRKDEFGNLGESIEQLRNQIIKQDDAQQTLLQHASHELKTPVMVIRSYAQSIQDGIYPKGNLSSTVQVIEEEAERLEKQIRDLLYITKLDYLATRETDYKSFNLKELIQEVADRLRWQRTEVEWELTLDDAHIVGDLEQWRVAIENLLDNQARYAEKQIKVTLNKSANERCVDVRIWNDGLPIEDAVMKRLFHQFSKGYKGEFGLGLAITQRIINLHNASIHAENEKDGVAFYISITRAQ